MAQVKLSISEYIALRILNIRDCPSGGYGTEWCKKASTAEYFTVYDTCHLLMNLRQMFRLMTSDETKYQRKRCAVSLLENGNTDRWKLADKLFQQFEREYN